MMTILTPVVIAAALLGSPLYSQGALEITRLDGGGAIYRAPPGEGGDFWLKWRHSVSGHPVRDRFAVKDGKLYLVETVFVDYDAGLGDRGEAGAVESLPCGAYHMKGLWEPVPAEGLVLRVGGAGVGHRIVHGRNAINLSGKAPGERVRIRWRPPDTGSVAP